MPNTGQTPGQTPGQTAGQTTGQSVALTAAQIKQLMTDSLTTALSSSGHLKLTPFDGEVSYSARDFIEDFEQNAKSKSWSDQNKFDRFGSYLTSYAKDWFKLTTTKSSTPPADWKDLKNQFLDHFLPKDRERHYRELLNKRKQGSREPVIHYIVQKKLLCLEVKPNMDESEMMLYIYEDMSPEIKKD